MLAEQDGETPELQSSANLKDRPGNQYSQGVDRHAAYFLTSSWGLSGVIQVLYGLLDSTTSEEWEFLEWNVLKHFRMGSVPITCSIHQGLIPQGQHLTKRCSQWVARQELRRGWVRRLECVLMNTFSNHPML